MSGLDALLDSLRPRLRLCGRGGVGKTSCAALSLLDAMQQEHRCMARAETSRLVDRISGLGLPVAGVLWNRVPDPGAEPLPMARALAQFESAKMVPASRGVDALRELSAAWEASVN